MAATRPEIQPVLEASPTSADLQIEALITGVGIPATVYQLTKYLQQHKPDYLINVGIAGAIDQNLRIGQLVLVREEQFGDLGAEDQDGSFLDLSQLGLWDPNQWPFQNGAIRFSLPSGLWPSLQRVSGLTVNQVHGSARRIEQLKTRVQAQVESMEGAAVAYVAASEKVPFLQLRSISNYVEPRNREAWEIGRALRNLHEFLQQHLEELANLDKDASAL